MIKRVLSEKKIFYKVFFNEKKKKNKNQPKKTFNHSKIGKENGSGGSNHF